MLEEIVKHVEMMPKDAVMAQIRRELIEAVVSKALPKQWRVIEARLQDLEQKPEGRTFIFHVTNFVLWINGVGGNLEVPRAKVFQDTAVMIKYLPYRKYRLVMKDGTIQLFPATTEPNAITCDMAEAILRRTNDKEFRKELYLKYNGDACKVMWINEDGLCSVMTTPPSGFQVKPLKELLA